MKLEQAVNLFLQWNFKNQIRVKRIFSIFLILLGSGLLTYGYLSGRIPFHLLRNGVRIQGAIVDYRLVNMAPKPVFGTSSPKYHWKPIVQFFHQGQKFQFEDRFLSNEFVTPNQPVKPPPGGPVSVLYDPRDPSMAMLADPVSTRLPIHWLPWAPMALMGLFLFLVGLLRLIGTLNVRTDSSSDKKEF